MSRLQILLQKLDTLKLEQSEYAIFGSAQLGIKGLREVNDLDILVTKKAWNKLIKQYPNNVKEKRIVFGDIEIFYDWKPWFTNTKDLFQETEIIDNKPFLTLNKVLEFKRLRNKEKDRKDIALIEEFLKK